MSRDINQNIYSLSDIFNAYNNYPSDDNDEILGFISELTGISTDGLIEYMNVDGLME